MSRSVCLVQQAKPTSDDLCEEEQVDGLVESTGAVHVWIDRNTLSVILMWCVRDVVGLALLNSRRQMLKLVLGVELCLSAGRGRDEATSSQCGTNGARSRSKNKTGLEAQYYARS